MEHAYFVGETFIACYPCDASISVKMPDCKWYRVNKDIYLIGKYVSRRLALRLHEWIHL